VSILDIVLMYNFVSECYSFMLFLLFQGNMFPTKGAGMKEICGYNLTDKEFKRLSELSNNIYNTAILIKYFCVNQPEIEELNNLTPTVKYLTKEADILNAFFIDFEKDDLE